jgi:hypothetical protein
LRKSGHTEFRQEGVVIEGWPVQFLPISSELDEEGLAQAIDVEIEGSRNSPPIRVRVLRPEHLVAIAPKVGRPKDHFRIRQFLDDKAVELSALRPVLDRHGLREKWSRFCAETGMPNPFGVEPKS